MLAWMVCLRPEGSMNLQVNSSTEADTTWSLGWFRGKADSNVRISLLRTLMQAILPNCRPINRVPKLAPGSLVRKKLAVRRSRVRMPPRKVTFSDRFRDKS